MAESSYMVAPGSAQELDYKRRLALALMNQGAEATPVQHWAQGLARLGQGALGGYEMYQAEKADKEERASGNELMAKFLMGNQGQAAAAPAAMPTASMPPANPAMTPPMGNRVASALAPNGPIPTNDRPEVMPSAKVWGDKEAVAAGLYDPPKPGQTAPPVAPAAPPAPTAQASMPAPAAPAQPGMSREALVAMLGNRNTEPMARAIIQSQLTQQFSPSFDFKTAGDTLYRTNAKTGQVEPVKDVGRGVKPMTEEQRREWKVPEGVAAGLDDNGKPVFSQPSNINTVSPVIAGINDRFDTEMKAAKAAPQIIASIHEGRRALDAGAITGAGAEPKLMLAKIGTMFGLSNDAVANTEVARAAVGNQVLESAKTLGANPSNADRDYIEKVKGGSITLDETSMRRLMDMQERWARTSVQRSNESAKKMISTDPEKLGRFAPMLQVEDPPSYQDYIKANPAQSSVSQAAPGKVRRFNPATGKIE